MLQYFRQSSKNPSSVINVKDFSGPDVNFVLCWLMNKPWSHYVCFPWRKDNSTFRKLYTYLTNGLSDLASGGQRGVRLPF